MKRHGGRAARELGRDERFDRGPSGRVVLDARELVLLKSSLPRARWPIVRRPAEELARAGYVDAYFPRAAGSLTVRCVNLRGERFDEIVLRPDE